MLSPRCFKILPGWRALCLVLLAVLVSSTGALQELPDAQASAYLPSGFAESTVALFGRDATPTAMAIAPDGRIFVTQKYGHLRVVKDGALLDKPFVSVMVNGSNERGLLGVALDPDFSINGYVYVYYTGIAEPVHNRISRFTSDPANPDVALAGSEMVLMDLEPVTTSYHNAGTLHFGPDRKLYASVGNDTVNAHSQSLDNRFGKVLRINPDGSIPTDNPFYETATGANRAIWAYGLRNPFRFAIQPETGRLFIGDVGEADWEELNEGVPGANYGWPACEGPCSPPDSRFRDPFFAYGHGLGDEFGYAITGGAFYNPPAGTFPSEYTGKFFFADYVNGWIRTLDPTTGAATTFAQGIPWLVDLAVGTDGALYYLTITSETSTYGSFDGKGALRKIQYTGIRAPQIGQDPAGVTAAAQTTATFEVRASGDQPLSYQWQRNGIDIPDAVSSKYTTPALTTSDSGAQFRAMVTNSYGTATSRDATLTVTANQAPVAGIASPAEGDRYRAGDTVHYAGTGSDPDDGALPAGAYRWQVDFHHDSHVHPGFVPAYSGATSGSFSVPLTGETSANVWFRITLTVTDSAGATSSTFRDIHPETSTITLATDPPGLKTTLDGQPHTAPYSVLSVENMTRTLGVVSPQTVNDATYQFVSWSDGGTATHDISTPVADVTYTARYEICSTCPPALSAGYTATPPVTWAPGETRAYAITLTNNGSQTWNVAGSNVVRLGVHFGTESDWPHDGWATDQRFPLPRDVAPGESVSLSIGVTAPSAGGTYVLRHRMVKENVAWFNEAFKTSVTISGSLEAGYVVSPPVTWSAGETRSYAITLTNAGTQSWNAAGTNPVRLGVHFGTASDWPHDGWATDQRFLLPGDVAPGQSVTLTLPVTAPSIGGSYVLRHRMVKENVTWFSQIGKASVTVGGDLGASYSVSPPTSWQQGETKSYTVTVTNTGGQMWNATGTNVVRLGVHFGTASDWPHDGWATDQRFFLPRDVVPGESVTVAVNVTAPAEPGGYVLRHRLVKENVAWFSQLARTDVTVGF